MAIWHRRCHNKGKQRYEKSRKRICVVKLWVRWPLARLENLSEIYQSATISSQLWQKTPNLVKQYIDSITNFPPYQRTRRPLKDKKGKLKCLLTAISDFLFTNSANSPLVSTEEVLLPAIFAPTNSNEHKHTDTLLGQRKCSFLKLKISNLKKSPE